MSQQSRAKDIAIIGMAGRFPEASNLRDFLDNLRKGRDSIRKVPLRRIFDTGLDLSRVYAEAGYLNDFTRFDYHYFGYSLGEAEMIDPQQRVLLEVVHEAVADAGYAAEGLSQCTVGVYLSDTNPNFEKAVHAYDPKLLAGVTKSSTAGRIARAFGFTGNAVMVDTACSSSLVALHVACNDILLGETEVAVVGTANISVFPNDAAVKEETGLLSATARTKAFSDEADGVGAGEAVCAVILKSLEQARQDGDPVYAVIKATSTNQDAHRSASLTAPSQQAQTELLVRAWQKAGVDPGALGYIEAHGTGTVLGDPIEIDAMNQAFRQFTDKRQFCAVASVKTNIGHTDTAAGLVGLIKATLALVYKELYPSLNFNAPNRYIDFIRSAVYVNTELRQWDTRAGAEKRYAGVSSFGFSGTNCHVVLGEYAGEEPAGLPGPAPTGLCLSAHNPESLHRLIRSVDEVLPANGQWEQLAYTLHTGRRHHCYRTVLPLSAGLPAADRQAIADGCTVHCEAAPEEVWLAFSGNGDVAGDASGALLRFPVFAQSYQQVMTAAGEPNGAVRAFACQYAAYHLLRSWNIAGGKLIGTGIGKVATACIEGKITLPEALAEVTRVGVREQADLRQRLELFVATKLNHKKAIVIEVAGAGEITDTLREMTASGSTLQLLSAGADQLDRLLQTCYLAGLSIAWQNVYPQPLPKVHAPALPLAPLYCWPTTSLADGIYQKMYQPAWKAGEPVKQVRPAAAGIVLLFADAYGISQALVPLLTREGHQVLLVRRGETWGPFEGGWVLDTTDREQLVRLRHALEETGQVPTYLIHLDTYRAAWEARAANDTPLLLLHQLRRAQVFEPWMDGMKGHAYITCQTHRLPGEGQALNYVDAPLHSFNAQIGLEHPRMTCRTLDFGWLHGDCPAEAVARLICQELFSSAKQVSVCYRQQQRHVLTLEPLPVAARHNDCFTGKDTLLITGGTRGIGLELVKYYGEKHSRHVVVLGRRNLPAKAHWPQIAGDPAHADHETIKGFAAVEAAGSTIHYFAIDLSNGEALEALAARLHDTIGPVKGILHVAGLLGRHSLEEHTEATYTEVTAPKIAGTMRLYEAFKGQAAYFVLFSSENALLPAHKSIDYSPANAFLDAFAQAENGVHCRLVSINWPGWRETGMWHRFYAANPPGAEELAQTITTAEGIALIELALSVREHSNVIVSNFPPHLFGANPYFEVEPQAAQDPSSPGKPPIPAPGEGVWGVVDESWDEYQNAVGYSWESVLKCKVRSLDDNFFELGGHSLMGLRIVNKLNARFNASLTYKQFASHSSVRQLAACVQELVREQTSASGTVERAIPAAVPKSSYEVSAAQKRIWITHQLDQRKIAYNLPGRFDFYNAIEEPALMRAIACLIERHEALRTQFVTESDALRQVIIPAEQVTLAIEKSDLTAEAEKELLLEKIITEQQSTPFDLANAPLLRVRLIKLDPQRYTLLFVLHHIICDGWSYNILENEMFALYEAFAGGRANPLPPVAVQYKDFSEWHNRLLASEQVARQRDFMLKEFGGALPRLNIPYDFARSRKTVYEGNVVQLKTDEAVLHRLKQISLHNNTSLFSTLLAVYSTLLNKLSGQEDIIVGTVLAGRRHADLEHTVGMFVNTLPLRNYVHPGQTFNVFLRTLGERTATFFDNQDFQFDDLAKQLGIASTEGKNPVFDVIFEMNNLGATVLDQMRPSLLKDRSPRGNVNMNASVFDLILTCDEYKDGLALTFNYNSTLFKHETAEFFATGLENIIRQVSENPEVLLADISIVPKAEPPGSAGTGQLIEEAITFTFE